MDTRISSITRQYNGSISVWKNKSSDEIVNNAYTIAKMQSLYEGLIYIIENGREDSNLDIRYANSILTECTRENLLEFFEEYEYGYDQPMWTTYENIAIMIIDAYQDVEDTNRL